MRADVSQPAEVEALIGETVRTFGRLDAALNNASTVDGVGPATADFTEEQFDQAIAGQLKSVWLCMRHEIRQMLAQDPPGGAIVNTSSVNGLGGARGGALYAAAKAGVLALAKSAAWEYATRGVRVNALVPGAFGTPMLRGAMRDIANRTEMPLDAVEAEYLRFIPQGRMATQAKRRPRRSGSAPTRHRASRAFHSSSTADGPRFAGSRSACGTGAKNASALGSRRAQGGRRETLAQGRGVLRSLRRSGRPCVTGG